ncbi:tetratricopeptide repeat protein, partial [Hansschlegelia zhihuaiae]
GGAGALLASGPLNADHVLALCPQYSVLDPELPVAPAWRSAMKGTPELFALPDLLSRTARVFVVVDPSYGTDMAHYRAVERTRPVTMIATPFAKHDAPKFLREAKLLSRLVLGVVAGQDGHRLVATGRRARRRCVARYWQGLGSATRGRWPAARARAVQMAGELSIDTVRKGGSVREGFSAISIYVGALAAAGRGAEAESVATEMVRLCPDEPSAFALVGGLAFQAGRLEEAERAFTAAIRIDKSANEIRMSLVRTLIRLGRQDDAARHLERCAMARGSWKTWQAVVAELARAGVTGAMVDLATRKVNDLKRPA